MNDGLARNVGLLYGIIICALAAFISLGSKQVAAESQGFPHAVYRELLKTYVDDAGMVNYSDLKANRKLLDEFAQSMSRLDPKDYDAWADTEKIAFWINAYNALTLKAIVDHYPIKVSFFKSFVYPDNSIRQIPGVWDKITFSVLGREITLDGIEHDILRAKFNEPRIHMALVCAAMGCPPLRNEPYVGGKLDSQLRDQSTKFLQDSAKFRIDRTNNKVYLSPIFDWFGEDFVKTYGMTQDFSGFPEKQKAVLHFISLHVEPGEKAYLMKGNFSIEYLKYDWSLNENRK
jgi:hypothetical protein